MPKKLLMGLVPMLVAVAAAIPPGAQAEPHYYRSGTLIPAGEKVPILEWGILELHPQPNLAPNTICEYSVGGLVENPMGGSAGIGQTTALSAWNCTNAGCPPGKVTIEGQEYEKEMTIRSVELPWPSVLIEESGIRTKSTTNRLSVACAAYASHRAAPGSPGYNEQIPLAEPTICEATAERPWQPLNENGHNSTVTSRLSFGGGTGALACGSFPVTGFTGKLKLIAYKESEVITVKNP